jgi:hypothetical protein
MSRVLRHPLFWIVVVYSIPLLLPLLIEFLSFGGGTGGGAPVCHVIGGSTDGC